MRLTDPTLQTLFLYYCLIWWKAKETQDKQAYESRHKEELANGLLGFGPRRRAKENLTNLPEGSKPSSTNDTLESDIREFTNHSENGHLLLAVTLVTLVPNDDQGNQYSRTQDFHELWNKFLLQAFQQFLPKSKRHYLIASKYSLHYEPTIHFHGIVCIKKDYAHKVWVNGSLNKRLTNTLRSWSRNERNIRPTRVKRFKVTRIANTPSELSAHNDCGGDAVSNWLRYAKFEKHRNAK